MLQLRLWALTAGLTALIWIAADQQVTKIVELNVPFEVKPAQSGTVAVEVRTSNVQFLAMTFQGPNRAINNLKSLYQQGALRARLEIESLKSGVYELDLVHEFQNQMDQFPSGLGVVAAYPPGITIDIDPYVQQTLPVRIDMGDLETDGQPQLEPSVVTVTVPERKFGDLREDQKAVILSGPAVFGGAAEGELIRKTVTLPAKVGEVHALRVEPSHVVLSATLKQRFTVGRIATVPIRVLISSDLIDRYRVIFAGQDDVVTRELTVRGPADLIRALQQNASQFDVKGYIEITQDDIRKARNLKDGEPLLKDPRFINLPTHVQLEQEPEKVEVRLLPRTGP